MGRDITELQRARRRLPMAEPVLRPVLDGLARYFRDRSSWRGGQKTPEFLAQIDRALAGVAGAPAGPAARDRAVVALVGIRRAFFPDAPSTNPPIPTWRATHHDRRIQPVRHLLSWLLVLGVVTLGVAWALRRLLARAGLYRLVWHPALFDLALFVVLLYGVTLISPYIFQRLA